MTFDFDLQLFGGGKGGNTTVQSYQPSAYELQLQKATADYADAVSPNALWLNNVARDVLQNSLGTVQVDYDELNRQAQEQIYQYMSDMYNSMNGNNSQLGATNRQLDAIQRQIPGIANDYVKQTNGLMQNNAQAANATNETLGDIAAAYGLNANQVNKALGNIANEYGATANQANSKLEGLVGTGDNAAADANAQLAQLLGKSTSNIDNYKDVRESLIRGELPSAYLQNMQDAVSGTMKRTAGEGLNALANRGILNSSVTEGVLNDIEKNASDALAAKYIENINTINNLLGNQTSEELSLLGQQAGIIGQQYGNTGDALNRDLNVYNTQTGNTNTALGQQGSIAQQQGTNNTTALGQAGNLAQQQLSNIDNANQQNAALIGNQYTNKMGALSNQAGISNQALQNQLGVQAQNASTLNGLLGHTADNITTAAAAQEAAQQPASNLWNMSLGLNNSTSGALAAAAGQGTTTTTSKSGNGGLFAGLMGGLF